MGIFNQTRISRTKDYFYLTLRNPSNSKSSLLIIFATWSEISNFACIKRLCVRLLLKREHYDFLMLVLKFRFLRSVFNKSSKLPKVSVMALFIYMVTTPLPIELVSGVLKYDFYVALKRCISSRKFINNFQW